MWLVVLTGLWSTGPDDGGSVENVAVTNAWALVTAVEVIEFGLLVEERRYPDTSPRIDFRQKIWFIC